MPSRDDDVRAGFAPPLPMARIRAASPALYLAARADRATPEGGKRAAAKASA